MATAPSVPLFIAPTGTGAPPPFWQFPPTWTPDQQSEWIEAMADLEREEKADADAKAAQEAAATDPAKLIDQVRADAKARREVRAAEERQRAEDAVFVTLEEKHGVGRVGRIETVDGAIMMRPQTETELDAAALRASRDGLSLVDQEKIHRQAILATVEHPGRARVEKTLGAYPLLWGKLVAERDRIISGVRADVEKKG